MDVKKMSMEEMQGYAADIRKRLVDVVSKNGGHLAPNLGVVELTMAIHRVFDSPNDKILFDVGHQSYVHKILTDREEKFDTIRKKGGLGPFTDPKESVHDQFIAGHAGNVLSAAYGIAEACKENKVIAIIGDASIANGQALEALNNIGGKAKNLIIVLNDNEMSIGKNVGSLSNFFSRILGSKMYIDLKKEVEGILRKAKFGGRLANIIKRIEVSLKHFVAPVSMSEDLGYRYIGPVDGHNLEELVKTFENLKDVNGPVFLHVKTQKGKGYTPAEENREKFHGISPFNVETGDTVPKAKTYSKTFGEKMLEIAENDSEVCLISAAMVKGIEAVEFFDKYSDRAYDVGIAEEHAVTFAGGLAISGKKPYVAIYSTFLQRAYDQIIHDISLQKLPVRFIIDRAGIVGEDGKTHQGVFDLSYILSIPNFTLIAPSTCSEFKAAMDYSQNHNSGPLAIRIPRTNCYDNEIGMKFEFGKWNEIKRGEKTLIIAAGSMLKNILEIQDEMQEKGINPTIVSAAFLNPLDEDYLKENIGQYTDIFVLEEAYEKNSFGTHVLEFLNNLELEKIVHKIGIKEAFVEHGARDELLEDLGLKGKSLLERIERCLNCAK